MANGWLLSVGARSVSLPVEQDIAQTGKILQVQYLSPHPSFKSYPLNNFLNIKGIELRIKPQCIDKRLTPVSESCLDNPEKETLVFHLNRRF